MKIFRLITAIVVSLLLFSGCDFFRSLVGKPTSQEIAAAKAAAEAAAKAKQQRDSLERVQAELDKAAAEAAAKQSVNIKRYNVIAGSFKIHDNAVYMTSRLRKAGFNPVVITLRSGFEAVSAAQFDTYAGVEEAIESLYEHEFCPNDVWVYDASTNLHESVSVL
ncbi:MAG: hypothetical protein HUJ89_01210 [Bacteroidales bacterium]|nr:hypothetical protein [Bacteroidales bacterium]